MELTWPSGMKGKAASFSFMRAYGAIVLGIVLVALLLDVLLAAMSKRDTSAEIANLHAPLFSVLTHQLERVPAAKKAEHLSAYTADMNIPVALIALDDFAGLRGLMSDADEKRIHVFYDSDDAAMLYQRIPESQLVMALGPLPGLQQDNSLEGLIISAYYALVALIVLLWIRPFYRDLSQLRQTAAEFGKEDFSARVQLSDKSSILPVAQSFNAMAARIEYLVSAHRELTNAVSHELRTPLARFKFGMEMLVRTPDKEKQLHYLDNMKHDAVELEGLIDEMLSYARLSEQNLLMDLVEVDMKQWLLQELKVYSGEPIRIACTFAIQPSMSDYRSSLNPELMARAIHNIIRNGLRYARSVINVHAQLNEDCIVLRVCDDGPGIPEAMHARIFEPFSRLETSRDKLSGGYGLGLAIAARILQRHQGKISVANCAPTGTCFTLNWPRNRRNHG